MRKRAQLSDEELALWAHVVESIRPMPGRKIPRYEPKSISMAEAMQTMTSISVTSTFMADSARPVSPTLKPLATMERRLRQRVTRGQASIDGVLDLHGMRQNEAHRALVSFIQRKHHDGAAVVMVITGKGARDDGNGSGSGTDCSERGVLKRMTPHWLADPGLRRYVIGYEDASHRHGGTGALYVRIRRAREAG
ncbi:MAG: Smr/MutS family protein [Beijerinckiaceae bacterium]